MRTLVSKLLVVFFLVPAYGIAEEEIQRDGDSDGWSPEFRCESDSDCMGFEICDSGECVFPMAEWRKGLEVEIRGGISTCVASTNDCNGGIGKIKPGGGGGVFVGIRPNPKFAAGIDFGYFAFGHDPKSGVQLDVENDDYDFLIRFLNVMAEVRGYVPYGYKSGWGDIYTKFGVGYLSFKEEYSLDGIDLAGIYPEHLYSFFNFKLGVGTTFSKR